MEIEISMFEWCNKKEIHEFLESIPYTKRTQWAQQVINTIIFINFKHDEDATAFKLRFNI